MTAEERLEIIRSQHRVTSQAGYQDPYTGEPCCLDIECDRAFLLRLLDEARQERDQLAKRLANLAILAPCPHSGDSTCHFDEPCDVCRLLGRE